MDLYKTGRRYSDGATYFIFGRKSKRIEGRLVGPVYDAYNLGLVDGQTGRDRARRFPPGKRRDAYETARLASEDAS